MESPVPSDQKSYNNTLSIVGILFFLSLVTILALWIQTRSANPSLSVEQQAGIFVNHFPNFLTKVVTSSIFYLLFFGATILVCAVGHKRASLTFRRLDIIMIVVVGVSTFLFVWSKM